MDGGAMGGNSELKEDLQNLDDFLFGWQQMTIQGEMCDGI